MSITISPTDDDLRTANARLAVRIADLERELGTLAGEARDAQALARQFKSERDAETTRADGLAAATEVLVADHLRREEQLATSLRKSRAEAEGLGGVCRRLQKALDTTRDEHRSELQDVEQRHLEDIAARIAVERELRAELEGVNRLRDAAKNDLAKRRFPGTRRHDR